ncbi:MAG: hypothetical protein Q8L24_02465 [bacterium]|nr:hypothetical protein [bacterium]
MWPVVPKIVHVLEKPVTELRDPIWSLEWSTKAFLSHFALGFLLGLLISSLVMFLSRYFKVAKICKWDFRRVKRREKNATFFLRIRYWIERRCFGRRYQALLFCDAFSFSLRVAFFSAVVANLIDLADHWPLFYGLPDRLLHPPGIVLATFIAIYCIARIVRQRGECFVRLYVFWLCLSLSIIAHVLEDYLLGWF